MPCSDNGNGFLFQPFSYSVFIHSPLNWFGLKFELRNAGTKFHSHYPNRGCNLPKGSAVTLLEQKPAHHFAMRDRQSNFGFVGQLTDHSCTDSSPSPSLGKRSPRLTDFRVVAVLPASWSCAAKVVCGYQLPRNSLAQALHHRSLRKYSLRWRPQALRHNIMQLDFTRHYMFLLERLGKGSFAARTTMRFSCEIYPRTNPRKIIAAVMHSASSNILFSRSSSLLLPDAS